MKHTSSMNHENILQHQQTKNAEKASPCLAPRAVDVLCGKDKTCINHEGSRNFRRMIDLYRDRYQKLYFIYSKNSVYLFVGCIHYRFIKTPFRLQTDLSKLFDNKSRVDNFLIHYHINATLGVRI